MSGVLRAGVVAPLVLRVPQDEREDASALEGACGSSTVTAVREVDKLLGLDALVSLLAQVAGDLHGAELGAAHGAELGVLEDVVAQGLVVHAAGRLRVQGEGELLLPGEPVA